MTAVTAAGVARRFPGVAESVHCARDFARAVLGPQHPALDTVDLLTTELVANAIAYTRSGLPGGRLTVIVQADRDGVLVCVEDGGAAAGPQLAADTVGIEEHGHGLRLVDVLADEWGSRGGPDGRTVWFRCAPVGWQQ